MFFSRHQAGRHIPTHRHHTASRRTCLCLTHMYMAQAIDTSGTHGLSCRQSAGRHARHRAVNDLIKFALASADVLARLEPSTLSRDDGKRPDVFSTAPWKEGRCLVWDFPCPDTLAASHLDQAVSGPGAVATEAEARKRFKCSSLAAMYYFVLVAVETLGALGDEVAQFISDLGRRIAATAAEPRSVAFLFQRLSVAVQRGNAACVTGTCAPSAKLDDIFISCKRSCVRCGRQWLWRHLLCIGLLVTY